MNKETTQILEYINKSGFYLDKIKNIRDKHNNIKDFTLMLSYAIMEIVSEEKKFINMSRKEIDLNELSKLFF